MTNDEMSTRQCIIDNHVVSVMDPVTDRIRQAWTTMDILEQKEITEIMSQPMPHHDRIRGRKIDLYYWEVEASVEKHRWVFLLENLIPCPMLE